jgi:hypothetical protein
MACRTHSRVFYSCSYAVSVFTSSVCCCVLCRCCFFSCLPAMPQWQSHTVPGLLCTA